MKIKLLLSAMILTMLLPAGVKAEDNGIAVNVNGTFLEMDQPPVIENGRTMVPLRAVGEALGCDIDWEGESKTATFVQGDVKAVITVGEGYILVGDGVYNEEFPIDTPATIINSRTMIPLRALSECFGYSVNWDAATKTVTINTKLMSADDTNQADEQNKIDTSGNSMANNVITYANILTGTTTIIDAVEYRDKAYEDIKAELNAILEEIENKSYDELVPIFTRLKEIDESLSAIADEAGVSDIVSDYYEPLIEPLKEIFSK